MSMPPLPTMTDLETSVLRMMGYGAMAGALKRMQPIVREHLKLAQDSLYEEYRDELTRVINKTQPGATKVTETLYDVPDDCDPQYVKRFRVEYSGYWRDLRMGIDTYQRSWEHPPGWPVRYDVRLGTSDQAQFEIWPEPDAVYALELEYYRRVTRFTEDEDKCSVDPWTLKLFALANLKNHYRMQDADGYSTQLQIRLARLKGKQHGNSTYKRGLRSDGRRGGSNAQHDSSTNSAQVILNDW